METNFFACTEPTQVLYILSNYLSLESNHNNVLQFRCIGGVKIFAKYDLPREIFMIFDDVVIKSMTVSHVNTWNTVIQCHEKS